MLCNLNAMFTVLCFIVLYGILSKICYRYYLQLYVLYERNGMERNETKLVKYQNALFARSFAARCDVAVLFMSR